MLHSVPRKNDDKNNLIQELPHSIWVWMPCLLMKNKSVINQFDNHMINLIMNIYLYDYIMKAT